MILKLLDTNISAGMFAHIARHLIVAGLLFLVSGPVYAQAGLEKTCCSDITREGLRSHATQNNSVQNHQLQSVPDGMVYIPGGEARIGSESGLPAERPVFTTVVAPFYMDKHLVTVGQFRTFLEATGHVTFSDEVGDGIVFDHDQARWIIQPGVNWEYPLGKSKSRAPDDHPVTLVTYYDAQAYLAWVGKRLPTEVEWEHAARGVTNRDHPYAWGEHLIENGIYKANTWTGKFPEINRKEDGYLLTSPVGIFGETELGLTDMGGNVWEWTSDWFRSYSDRNKPFTPGPDSEKVLRGGSFMCHVSYCHGYRVSARSHTPPDNNMFHIGFRGVRDIE
jgi:formylglycine-generating enzyme